MMKKMTFLISLSLGFASAAFAEENEPSCCIIPAEPLDPCCIAAGYPYPADYSTSCGWDIYACGDFLYWSIGLDIAQNYAQVLTFNQQATKNYFHNSPYKPGFRVSLGIEFAGATVDLKFLRWNNPTTLHARAGAGEMVRLVFSAPGLLFGPPTLPDVVFSKVTSRQHLDINWGALTVNKPVYMGERVIMNLGYGLAMHWSSEKWNFDCLALNSPLPLPPFIAITSNGFVAQDHRSWAIGPCLTFNGTALLPYGFEVIGSILLSVQYASMYKGITTISFPAAPFTTDNTTLKNKGHIPHVQPVHGGEIGLGWGDYFWCDRIHLDLSITYAFYMQHCETLGFPASSTAIDVPGLVHYNMHGITIGGRIDF